MWTSPETCSIPSDSKTRDMLKELRKWILTEEQYCEPSLRRTQIQGDKKKWTIVHFGQIHAILDEQWQSCSWPELERRIIEWQKQIYEALKKERPDIVMVEGFVGWEPALVGWLVQSIFDDTVYAVIRKSWKERELLDGFYVKSREEAKDRLFYLLWGGIIYWALQNKPTIWAETQAKNEWGMDVLKKTLGVDILSCINIYKALKAGKMEDLVKVPKEIGEVREREALSQARRVLKGNPWKKITLVYWEWHDFSGQYFKVFGSIWPTLERQEFPQISTQALSISADKSIIEQGKPVMKIE